MRKLWDYFGRPNSAATAFLIAGAIWFVAGTLYGLLAAMDLVAPEIFNNIPFLAFGRARPVHVNTVLYGFVTTMLIGCGLYYVPALLRTKLWSERLGWLSFALWNIAILSGPLTFSFGLSQGREYAEYLWIFDVSLTAALLVGVFNLFLTIANRREDTLYVSVWYFVGAFLWTSAMYPIGNVMWRPATGAMPGLVDSLFLWYYGHNLPGLLLTPLAVGAAYYVIPRVAKTPLYSHTLSLVGFWTIVTLYSHIGGHHILQAPVPNWLKVMSVVDSVAMVIPVFTVLVNLWMTARRRSGSLLGDPAGRFVIMGTVWYTLTSIQGSLQSITAIQRVTHFNNWTIGHAHIAVLGFAGFIALGALWHILPLATGRRVYSNRLVNLQFGLLTVRVTGFFVVLTIAGLIQGEAWNNGETVYRVLPETAVYMMLRAALGMSIIAAAVVGLVNLVLTLQRGERFDPAPLAEEVRPMKMTPALLVVGSLVIYWASVYVMVVMPITMMSEEKSDIWCPWTEQEQAGHKLYVGNGCHYCHSLYIRTNDWDLGAERIAQRGDYVGQEPAILGTERTGPDLSQAGGEHPDEWHVAHFTNPRNTRPNSLMPSWEFLGNDDIRKLTAFVQAQGGKNADVRVARQDRWRTPARQAYEAGVNENVRWLHAQIPDVWRPMPNPYPATEATLLRGQKVYQDQCAGCHGPIGDGATDAARYMTPPPLNFTVLRGRLDDGKYIGGIFYYQIMNGITGTAMPYFKRDLESEKIWDVSNYVAVYFLGYTDAGNPPKGIDASYEPLWKNPYAVPQQVEQRP